MLCIINCEKVKWATFECYLPSLPAPQSRTSPVSSSRSLYPRRMRSILIPPRPPVSPNSWTSFSSPEDDLRYFKIIQLTLIQITDFIFTDGVHTGTQAFFIRFAG